MVLLNFLQEPNALRKVEELILTMPDASPGSFTKVVVNTGIPLYRVKEKRAHMTKNTRFKHKFEYIRNQTVSNANKPTNERKHNPLYLYGKTRIDKFNWQ